MNPLQHLVLPEFKNYVVIPNNSACVVVDRTRLMVEILWGLRPAPDEFLDSSQISTLIIEGEFALVFRYKREKDGKYHPACSMSFRVSDSGCIHVCQIQGSNDKKIAFRFHSSFDIHSYLIKVLEESFIKKGIPVTVERFPTGIEWSADVGKAFQKYENFWNAIIGLHQKYRISQK